MLKTLPERTMKVDFAGPGPFQYGVHERNFMRVMVIEDQSNMALMLKRAFEEHGHVASVALNGEDGLAMTMATAFDVILLDLMLPDRTGLSIVEELRAHQNRTPILVLTAKDTVGDMVSLLDAGADDYVVKPFALAELRARVRALARRGPIPQSTQLRAGDLSLNPATGEVARGKQRLMLTRTERLLLEVLLRHAGRPVSRQTILDAVWGSDAELASNTVDAFIKLLRDKVDEPFKTRLIHTVRGVGYQLIEGREL
jgi:two-component system OmpR family response regulator